MALVAPAVSPPIPSLKRVAFHQHCHLIPDAGSPVTRIRIPRRGGKNARPSSSGGVGFGRPTSSSGSPSGQQPPTPRLSTPSGSSSTSDSYFPSTDSSSRASVDKSLRPRIGSRGISGKVKGRLSKFGIGSSSEQATEGVDDQVEELSNDPKRHSDSIDSEQTHRSKASVDAEVKRERSQSRNRFGLGGSRTDLLLNSTANAAPLKSALRKPREAVVDQQSDTVLESFESSAAGALSSREPSQGTDDSPPPSAALTRDTTKIRAGEGPPIAYFADESAPLATAASEVVCVGDSTGLDSHEGDLVPLITQCSCKDCDERIQLGLVEDYEPTWSRSARIKYLSDRQRAQVLARQRLDAADRLAGRGISPVNTPPPGLLGVQSSFGQLAVEVADGSSPKSPDAPDSGIALTEDQMNAIALAAILDGDSTSPVSSPVTDLDSSALALKLGPQPRRSSLDLGPHHDRPAFGSISRSPAGSKSPEYESASENGADVEGEVSEEEEEDEDLGAEAKARLLDAIRDDPTGEALALALSATNSRAGSRKSSVHDMRGLAEKVRSDRNLQAAFAREASVSDGAAPAVQPAVGAAVRRPIAVVRPLSFGGEPADLGESPTSEPKSAIGPPLFSDDDLADELSALRVKAENQARWSGNKSSGARAMMRQLDAAEAKENQTRKRLSMDSCGTTTPPPDRFGTPVWTPPSRTNSPLPRGTSPLARTASPLNRAASPIARTASPLQRTSSPGHVNGWVANDTSTQGATLLSDVALAGNMAFNTCLNAYSPDPVEYESATSSLQTSPIVRLAPLRQDSGLPNPSKTSPKLLSNGTLLPAKEVVSSTSTKATITNGHYSAALNGHTNGNANGLVAAALEAKPDIPKLQVESASASSTLTFRPTPIRPTAQAAVALSSPEDDSLTPTSEAFLKGALPKRFELASEPSVAAPPRLSSVKRPKPKGTPAATDTSDAVQGAFKPRSAIGTAQPLVDDDEKVMTAGSLGFLDANTLPVLPQTNQFGLGLSHSSLRLGSMQDSNDLTPTSESSGGGNEAERSETLSKEMTQEERQRVAAAERAARRERARRQSNSGSRPSTQSSRPSSRGLDRPHTSSGTSLGVDELPPQPLERVRSDAANGKFWTVAMMQSAPAPGMIGTGAVHRGTHSHQRSVKLDGAKGAGHGEKGADRRKSSSGGVMGGLKGMLGRKKEK